MRTLQRILRISILTLVVFSASSFVTESYAYWSGGLLGSNDTSATSVTIGTWATTPEYDANTSYSVGDIVTNNGSTYQAKKSGFLREPGVAGGWARDWILIG